MTASVAAPAWASVAVTVLLLMLAVSSVATTATVGTAAAAAAAPPSDPLRKWLYDLVIPVGNISVELPSPLKTPLNITNLECTHLLLGTLKSGSNPTTATYTFSSNGISITCNGRYAFKVIEKFSGSATLELTDKSAINLAVRFVNTSLGLIDKVVPETVDAKLKTKLTVDNKILNDIIAVIDALITPTVNKKVTQELTTLIGTNLTTFFKDIDKDLAPYLIPRAPPAPPQAPAGASNLETSSLLFMLDFFLDQAFDRGYINDLVDALTNGTGRVDVPIKDLSFTFPIKDMANITVGITEVAVSGLDTWRNDTAFIAPHNKHMIRTYTDLGKLSINVSWFIIVSTKQDLPDLYESANFSLTIENATLLGDALLAVNGAQLEALAPGQLFEAGCVLDTLLMFNATQFATNFTTDQLAVVPSHGTTQKDIDDVVDNLLAVLLASASPAVPAFLDSFILDPARLSINTLAAEAVAANHTCNEPATSASKAQSTAGYSAIAGVIALFALIAYILFRVGACKLLSSDSENQPLLTNSSSYRSRINSVSATVDTVDAPCLALEPLVPISMRFLVPLILLSTIGLLAYSNNSPGAMVYPIIVIGNDTIKFDSLFIFTLGNSVNDMMHAHVYFLGLLIAVFSGFWPHCKLLLMLVCWLVPKRWICVEKRETLLQFLDALGKWSLIDTFVMVFMIVGFYFHLPFEPKDSNAEEGAFNLIVQPGEGIYTFVSATVVSLIMSHLILFFHRRAADSHHAISTQSKAQTLATHMFTSKKSQLEYRFTHFGKALIPAILFASFGIYIWGAFKIAFTFQFKGLAALAMADDRIEPDRSFSLISLGKAISASVQYPDDPGVRFLQCLFFIFALAIPLTHVCGLLLLWLVPFNVHKQRTFYHVIETLNAWSCPDVFIVSLIVSVLEIGKFAQFIIGDKCDPINAMIAPYAKDWPKLRGEGKCFDVSTVLGVGSYLLISSAALIVISTIVVQPVCKRAIRERLFGKDIHSHRMHTSSSRHGLADPGKPTFALRLAAFLQLLKIEGYAA